MTFTRFTGHFQGLYTVPSTFVRYDLYTILTRLRLLVLCASCTVVYTVSYGLTRLSRSCTIAYTIIHGHRTRASFFKSFKNHTRLTRIHSNGPSVSRIRPRFIRLYVRFTRVANRVPCVLCETGFKPASNFELLIVPSRYFCGGSFCFMSWF